MNDEKRVYRYLCGETSYKPTSGELRSRRPRLTNTRLRRQTGLPQLLTRDLSRLPLRWRQEVKQLGISQFREAACC